MKNIYSKRLGVALISGIAAYMLYRASNTYNASGIFFLLLSILALTNAICCILGGGILLYFDAQMRSKKNVILTPKELKEEYKIIFGEGGELEYSIGVFKSPSQEEPIVGYFSDGVYWIHVKTWEKVKIEIVDIHKVIKFINSSKSFYSTNEKVMKRIFYYHEFGAFMFIMKIALYAFFSIINLYLLALSFIFGVDTIKSKNSNEALENLIYSLASLLLYKCVKWIRDKVIKLSNKWGASTLATLSTAIYREVWGEQALVCEAFEDHIDFKFRYRLNDFFISPFSTLEKEADGLDYNRNLQLMRLYQEEVPDPCN